MRILVATKMYNDANRIIDTLTGYFEVRHAESEWEVESELSNREYSILILDYELPQISGYKLVEELSEKGLLPSAVFVCGQDAVGYNEDRLKALVYGKIQMIPVIDMDRALREILLAYPEAA